jgi:hypothetical protein
VAGEYNVAATNPARAVDGNGGQGEKLPDLMLAKKSCDCKSLGGNHLNKHFHWGADQGFGY